MAPGHPETRTRDTRCNGTACLMAALDIATCKVVTRHRLQEFPAFLDYVASATEVHVIPDNVSPHKSAEVQEWSREHPRWSVR